ncbi:thioredoxin fold domain-containing protein [Mucilaginibacter sp. X4EP1]|uniref:thioredoxin family protein n=1 Tax=Mucilaginibacter sp. X4EP1 TaxID=2723092 RepID=UPI003B00C71E
MKFPNLAAFFCLAALFSLSNSTLAQGVRFEHGMSWPQILAKAKAEHKCIFIDCYATWCGPCKTMDAEVYPLKPVGDAYNKNFISVRMQMDQTATDSDDIKMQYGPADLLERSYYVNAYPTFLFFDPNGNPIHKVTGRLSPKDFIQLAADASNPGKQYYSILKNFQPGKLDTAEEKGLARSFIGSDKELAGKIAADYLGRIPISALDNEDNGKLMVQLQSSSKVVEIASNYIAHLNASEFGKKNNLAFIAALGKQPKVRELALNYITHLRIDEFAEENNLAFIARFNKEPEIKKLAKDYISGLSENQLLTKSVIQFVYAFIQVPADKGFSLFYSYSTKIDSVMANKDYAQGTIELIVNKTEFSPLLAVAKEKTEEPDWTTIFAEISKKYDPSLAERIITDGKVDWYSYLVKTKKEDKYWPELIDSKIQQVEHVWDFKRDAFYVNNIAWLYIFLHSTDPKQLDTAIRWLKVIVEEDPGNGDNLDTYACLLYKAGNHRKALDMEQKALTLFIVAKNKSNVENAKKTIAKMKNKEDFWLEKEYLNP